MYKILFQKTHLITLLAIFTLSACGGGSGDDVGTNLVDPPVVVDPPVIVEPPVVVEPPVEVIPEDKSFKISASAIVIKRISNDEALAVDISAIQSEELILTSKD